MKWLYNKKDSERTDENTGFYIDVIKFSKTFNHDWNLQKNV